MHSDTGEVLVRLLGGFELDHGHHRISVPLGTRRLLAYLALQGAAGAHRSIVADRLWPDSSPDRAAAHLRSALWRGRRSGDVVVIEAVGPRLRLGPRVDVDSRDIIARLADPEPGHQIEATRRLSEMLHLEMLPDWSEDWLTLERERWDQTRVHGLEQLAGRLLAQEHYLAALQTALGAAAIEPVRETAHRLVIEVHIAEGNVASALRHYQRYRALLQRELGVAPSSRMAHLVRPLMPT